MSENEVEVFNEYHRQRVSKTPDRIENAIKQFEDNGIEYRLLNEETGHFHCHRKSDGGLYQFWARLYQGNRGTNEKITSLVIF